MSLEGVDFSVLGDRKIGWYMYIQGVSYRGLSAAVDTAYIADERCPAQGHDKGNAM